MSRNLIVNKVRCKICGEVLESRHRHDYKTCSCDQKTMIDGGLDYGRYGGVDLDQIEHLSVYDNDPHDLIRQSATWGTYGKNGDQPISYIKIADMTNNHINAILEKFGARVYPTMLKAFKDELLYRQENNIIIEDNE